MRRELAVQVARSPFGQAAAWPVVETVQRDGQCVEVLAPAPGLDAGTAAAAQQLALRIADAARRDRAARRRAVRHRRHRRGPDGQRAGDAAAQLRALDDRGRPDVAVRAAPARGPRLPARVDGADRAGGRDGERPRCAPRRWRCRSTSGCTTCSPGSRTSRCTSTARRSAPPARSGTSPSLGDRLDEVRARAVLAAGWLVDGDVGRRVVAVRRRRPRDPIPAKGGAQCLTRWLA